jgi:hypothetical protein
MSSESPTVFRSLTLTVFSNIYMNVLFDRASFGYRMIGPDPRQVGNTRARCLQLSRSLHAC